MSFIIFFAGAAGYSAIELLFRGYTHWSMALTGGACLLAFHYYIIEYKETSTLLKAAAGACIITIFEFFVGIVVNLWYGWDVWDYSNQPGNLLGQICPLYTFAWFMICFFLLLISSNLHSLYQALQTVRRSLKEVVNCSVILPLRKNK